MKSFNTTAVCIPSKHYMVDISGRIKEIRKMVDAGKYFTINRARQFGKTTTLNALCDALQGEYVVISLSFEGIGNAGFASEGTFVLAFCRLLKRLQRTGLTVPDSVKTEIEQLFQQDKDWITLGDLSDLISDWCDVSEKKLVLLIDEIDSATNNQVFMDFLAQLRGAYISRESRGTPAFHSVILAGVHDIRNLQLKIRSDSEHRHNSPWNIAARFDVDMSFSPDDIAGMLTEYEADHHTGMDIKAISQLIYDYTSGYPVLVSIFGMILDEQLTDLPEFPDLSAAWTKKGILRAEKLMYKQRMPLFESLINKLEENDKLRDLVYRVLFHGERIPFNIYDATIGEAAMYGFLKDVDGVVTVANRIFQNTLYDWFLSQERNNEITNAGSKGKPSFIQNGHLNMELVLERFVQSFSDIYGNNTERFIENDGRKLFLMYLRPIINGVGNCYIESQTMDLTRTDVIVDYLGEQFIIEMKIWHGAEYNARGEQQLIGYLENYHVNKGYMLSFNFNQNKEVGLHTIQIGDKTIVEAIV